MSITSFCIETAAAAEHMLTSTIALLLGRLPLVEQQVPMLHMSATRGCKTNLLLDQSLRLEVAHGRQSAVHGLAVEGERLQSLLQ